MDVGPNEVWGTVDNKVKLAMNNNASDRVCGPDRLKCRWSGDEWTARTIEYLEARRNKSAPFFLYLSYTAPHAGSFGAGEDGSPVPRISTGTWWLCDVRPTTALDVTALMARGWACRIQLALVFCLPLCGLLGNGDAADASVS
jgi:hypothetical protein